MDDWKVMILMFVSWGIIFCSLVYILKQFREPRLQTVYKHYLRTNYHVFLAILIATLMVPIVAYVLKFSANGLADTPEYWGQMGDFFGGLLNPLLAFSSFMALLYTLQIQSKQLEISREELEATRIELTASRIAQEQSSEALRGQLASLERQNFETTYFKIMNLTHLRIRHTEIKQSDLEEILNPKVVEDDPSDPTGPNIVCGPKSFSDAHRWGDAFNVLNEKLPDFGIFSTYLESTLSYAFTHSPFYSQRESSVSNVTFYTDLLNAILPKDTLILLIIWCSHGEDSTSLKHLLEHFYFFAALKISYEDEIGHGLPLSLSGISKRAFTKELA